MVALQCAAYQDLLLSDMIAILGVFYYYIYQQKKTSVSNVSVYGVYKL